MKRKDGSGSVTYDKNSRKLIARILVEGKYKKKSFPKNQQQAAEKWLRDMSISQKSYIDVTTGEWIIKFITDYKEPFLRPRSLERVKQAAYKLQPLFNIQLADLRNSDIQDLINQLHNNNLSASTIKKTHELLKAALNQAIAEQIINYNPAIAVKRPQTAKKAKVEVFTNREIGLIFHALRKLQNSKKNTSQRYDMLLFFRILLTTGLRVSELLALRWEHVDCVNHVLSVEGSKDIDKQIINATKTASGVRSVPLLSIKTRELLYFYRKKTGYIFENKNSGAMSYQRVFLTWNNVRKLTGITKTIHTFRHTCASYLIASGKFTLAEIAQMLGHSSPAVTLSVYTHVIQKQRAKAGTDSGQT